MKEKLVAVLVWGLVLHLVVSATFILDPPFLKGSRLSFFYKRHLLPGPFFTPSKIVDNYSFALSWNLNGIWTPAFNPVKEEFNRYHSSLKPTNIYGRKISQSLCIKVMFPDSWATDIKDREEFVHLKQFLYDQYVPMEADSVRLWIINKKAENFMIRKDSVLVEF